ncbi:MAG: PAS domain S-box protein, partial [Rhodocyclaceae bacterium]|nr:PAS domain S-box protein [Rhodocyclaceae bacterium]
MTWDAHRCEVARGQQAVAIELRIIRADGETRWIEHLCQAVVDPAGKSLGTRASNRDITERKRGEEALLQYENVVSSSTDAMSLVGCDYVYMTVNNTYLRRTGLARDQIVGKPVAEIMGQADFDEVIKPRIDQCLAGDTVIYSEWFDFPAEGRRHVDVTYSPCWNRKQEVTGVVVIARDVTERKRAEETLAHSEGLLKRTQSLAKVGGWEWDVQAQAMSWTEETYRIHEMTPGEVPTGSAEHITRSLACYDEPNRTQILEAFRRCAEEGESYDYEVPFTTAKGRRMWVRTIAVAVWDGGKIARVAGNLVDITERKRTEEVLQARLRLSEAAGKIGMEELLRQALDETERITGSSIGFVHFFDEDQKALSLQMWSTNTLAKLCSAEGKGRHYGLDEAGVWADCIRERRPVIHNDYPALPHRKGMPAGHTPVVRELVVPILRNERIVAVLGVGNKPQEYDQRDVEMVQSLA